MPNARRWIPRLLLESALIVFSVMFALALDAWRDDRVRAEEAELALSAIRAELVRNREAVARANRFHWAVHDTLSVLDSLGQLPPYEIYAGRGMLQPAAVVTTAWESARETGALRELPYPLVLKISSLYFWQGKYRELADDLVVDIYTDIRRQGVEPVLRDGFRGFMAIAEDFANREGALLKSYDSVLAALNGEEVP